MLVGRWESNHRRFWYGFLTTARCVEDGKIFVDSAGNRGMGRVISDKKRNPVA